MVSNFGSRNTTLIDLVLENYQLGEDNNSEEQLKQEITAALQKAGHTKVDAIDVLSTCYKFFEELAANSEVEPMRNYRSWSHKEGDIEHDWDGGPEHYNNKEELEIPEDPSLLVVLHYDATVDCEEEAGDYWTPGYRDVWCEVHGASVEIFDGNENSLGKWNLTSYFKGEKIQG